MQTVNGAGSAKENLREAITVFRDGIVAEYGEIFNQASSTGKLARLETLCLAQDIKILFKERKYSEADSGTCALNAALAPLPPER